MADLLICIWPFWISILFSGVGESSAITCGFDSVDDFVKLALKLGIKYPNSTIRMIAGSSYPTNSAEVGSQRT